MKCHLKQRCRNVARELKYKRIKNRRIRRDRKNIPPYSECKNCGEPLQGMYCHKCGQYALDINQPFGRYINEYFQNAYQYDGRLVATMRLMFTRPGKLSSEFDKGRINRYVHPLKLYMFISIVFFSVLLAFVPALQSTGDDVFHMADSVQMQSSNTEQILLNIGADSVRQDSVQKTETETAWEKIKLNRLKELFFSEVKNTTPLIMICLLPLYALILRRTYRKYCTRYLSCFIFAIHTQTLMLILTALSVLLTLWFQSIYIWQVMSLIVFAYVVVSSHNFFKTSWIKSFFKTLWSFGSYVILSVLIASSVIVAKIYYAVT